MPLVSFHTYREMRLLLEASPHAHRFREDGVIDLYFCEIGIDPTDVADRIERGVADVDEMIGAIQQARKMTDGELLACTHGHTGKRLTTRVFSATHVTKDDLTGVAIHRGERYLAIAQQMDGETQVSRHCELVCWLGRIGMIPSRVFRDGRWVSDPKFNFAYTRAIEHLDGPAVQAEVA